MPKVVALIIKHGGSETPAVATAPHCMTAQDQGGARKLAQIDATFAPEVARIVRQCSDTFVDGTPS